MPGADPERSAPGVFLWGGCQNRLRLSFGERCVRVAGQMKMPGIVFAIWSSARPGGWADQDARDCVCHLERGAHERLGR